MTFPSSRYLDIKTLEIVSSFVNAFFFRNKVRFTCFRIVTVLWTFCCNLIPVAFKIFNFTCCSNIISKRYFFGCLVLFIDELDKLMKKRGESNAAMAVGSPCVVPFFDNISVAPIIYRCEGIQ